MYVGWEDHDAMLRDFEITSEDSSPDEILLAVYDIDCYEGSAFVLFIKDGTLYEVNASHCSCMGLEGQWVPEVTLEEAVKNYKHHQDLIAEVLGE